MKYFLMGLIVILSVVAIKSDILHHIPYGANVKMHHFGGEQVNGHWETDEHHPGNWGRLKCYPGGGQCRSWDCATWWFSIVGEPANPVGDYTTSYNIPIGYDPITQEYIY